MIRDKLQVEWLMKIHKDLMNTQTNYKRNHEPIGS